MGSELDETLDGISAVFLDLDGTIYLGDSLIDGALGFLDRLEERGVSRYFLSNNSSKSVGQYVEKLRALGIRADEEEILLSTHDLLSWLSSKGVERTFLVGTEGMRSMLEEKAFIHHRATRSSSFWDMTLKSVTRNCPPPRFICITAFRW